MSLKIRIRQYAFIVGKPYSAGDKLREHEAEALNRLRAENIRNNVKPWVDKACEGLRPGELLTPGDLATLSSRIAAYARNYDFEAVGEPRGRGAKPSPLEMELRLLAEEKVREKLGQLGIELSETAFEAEVERFEQYAEVQQEARRRLLARSEIAKRALDDLIS